MMKNTANETDEDKKENMYKGVKEGEGEEGKKEEEEGERKINWGREEALEFFFQYLLDNTIIAMSFQMSLIVIAQQTVACNVNVMIPECIPHGTGQIGMPHVLHNKTCQLIGTQINVTISAVYKELNIWTFFPLKKWVVKIWKLNLIF